MKTLDILGRELWLCESSEEAAKLWKQHPKDRWRIVSENEASTHCLDGAAEVEAWMQAKVEKPGPHMGICNLPSQTPPQEASTWCSVSECLCSNKLPGSICERCEEKTC